MAKIFDHLLNRSLAHVTRFNNRPQHFPESVAEHTFFVSYFALLICELIGKEKIKIDAEKVLKMAIIHDFEESLSGDILNPFKHYNDKVYETIKEVNEELIQEAFAELPKNLQEKFINIWQEETKENTIESQVVKVADKLSLLSKCFPHFEIFRSF